MKKILFALMSAILCLSFSITAFASTQGNLTCLYANEHPTVYVSNVEKENEEVNIMTAEIKVSKKQVITNVNVPDTSVPYYIGDNDDDAQGGSTAVYGNKIKLKFYDMESRKRLPQIQLTLKNTVDSNITLTIVNYKANEDETEKKVISSYTSSIKYVAPTTTKPATTKPEATTKKNKKETTTVTTTKKAETTESVATTSATTQKEDVSGEVTKITNDTTTTTASTVDSSVSEASTTRAPVFPGLVTGETTTTVDPSLYDEEDDKALRAENRKRTALIIFIVAGTACALILCALIGKDLMDKKEAKETAPEASDGPSGEDDETENEDAEGEEESDDNASDEDGTDEENTDEDNDADDEEPEEDIDEDVEENKTSDKEKE